MSSAPRIQSGDEIANLRASVLGPVFVPGDSGYDEERTGFQTARRHEPAVVVGVTSIGDVETAVAFAAAHRMPVAVQSAGHAVALPDRQALLISTRRMDRVDIHVGKRVAVVEAGVTWGKVVAMAAAHGLAPLCGSDPKVGVVSYTLGGGIGLMARRFGFAADHVRSVDLVAADGRRRRVTPSSDPELFWAVRGGRSNFGVVTQIEIELFPVRSLFGGGLYFAAEHAPDVLHAYRRWAAGLTDDTTSSIAIAPFPDAGHLAPEIRRRHVVHVRVAHVGDNVAGERLIAPLREAAPLMLDTIRHLPYADVASIHHDPPEPMGYFSTNTVLADLDEPTVDALLAAFGTSGPQHCIIELRHLGGALERSPVSPSSVSRRGAGYLLNVVSRVTPSVSADDLRPLHSRIVSAVDPDRHRRNLNFLTSGHVSVDDVRASYEHADYRRLAALKAQYDPHNLFRSNHNIPPAPQTDALLVAQG